MGREWQTSPHPTSWFSSLVFAAFSSALHFFLSLFLSPVCALGFSLCQLYQVHHTNKLQSHDDFQKYLIFLNVLYIQILSCSTKVYILWIREFWFLVIRQDFYSYTLKTENWRKVVFFYTFLLPALNLLISLIKFIPPASLYTKNEMYITTYICIFTSLFTAFGVFVKRKLSLTNMLITQIIF